MEYFLTSQIISPFFRKEIYNVFQVNNSKPWHMQSLKRFQIVIKIMLIEIIAKQNKSLFILKVWKSHLTFSQKDVNAS